MSLRLTKNRLTGTRVALLALVALLATLLPALPSHADVVTDVHYVPTTLSDNSVELMRVEIRRNTAFDAQGQGFQMTMSPYNLTPTGTGVGDGLSAEGIAQVQADVLGTRGSTGCWDYGGIDEQKAAVDVVRFLAGDIADENGVTLDYSNGRVGMTGVSYDGTTANMVAGAPREMWEDSIDADGTTPLKAIVPVAAISHWYGYAYYDGVRMLFDGESTSPTDEDILTPLAFDLGFGLTVHEDQIAREDAVGTRGCGTVDHTAEAYSRNPDYTDFWQSRDYTTHAEDWTTNTLIVHGWNDYNVKQYEATYLYDALAPHADNPLTDEDEGFDLRLWMTQSRHANGNGEDLAGNSYATVRDNFWRTHLLEDGTDAQVAAEAFIDGLGYQVRSLGETTDGAAEVSQGNTWPLETTERHSFFLNRTYEQDGQDAGIPVAVPGPGTGEVGELSYSNAPSGPLDGRSGSYGPTSGWADTGLTGEELATNDPWSNDGQKLDQLGGQGYYSLHFATNPLNQDVQIAGSAELEGYFNYIAGAGSHLSPILVDIDPEDNFKVIQRGLLNLDYREGLESTAPMASGNIAATVRFMPEDYTVPAGHRIGMILTSSNPQWAVPGTPAGFVSVLLGPNDGLTITGTQLHLPIVGVDADTPLFTDFVHPEPAG